MTAHRLFSLLFLICASSGSHADTLGKITALGNFTNFRYTAEHEYGSAVEIWRQGDSIFGLFSHTGGQLIGNTPVGVLEHVSFDADSGRIAFTAKLTVGRHACKIHEWGPSEDFYHFDGILNLSSMVLSGTLTHFDNLHLELPKTEEKITLPRDRNSAGWPTFQSRAEWQAAVKPVLDFRGPAWGMRYSNEEDTSPFDFSRKSQEEVSGEPVVRISGGYTLSGLRCELTPHQDATHLPNLAKVIAGDHAHLFEASRVSTHNPFGAIVIGSDRTGLPSGSWQHTGIDVPVNIVKGTMIRAADNGVVVFSTAGIPAAALPSSFRARGGVVVIKHVVTPPAKFKVPKYACPFGGTGKQCHDDFSATELLTYYLHLHPDYIKVTVGAQILAGQEIGRTYTTSEQNALGMAYPPHLHFELWWGCTTNERNGYEPLGSIFESFVGNPLIDPIFFEQNGSLKSPSLAHADPSPSAPLTVDVVKQFKGLESGTLRWYEGDWHTASASGLSAQSRETIVSNQPAVRIKLLREED